MGEGVSSGGNVKRKGVLSAYSVGPNPYFPWRGRGVLEQGVKKEGRRVGMKSTISRDIARRSEEDV